MIGLFNNNEKKLKRRLKKAEKAHARYTTEVENLKDTFYEEFDNKSIELLFTVVREKGHPGEVNKIDEFESKYKGDNIDEIDIKLFKKCFNSYEQEILKKRTEKGE